MNEFKGTPGQYGWQYEDEYGEPMPDGQKSGRVVIVAFDDSAPHWKIAEMAWGAAHDDEPIEANARLLAASWDLLRAIQTDTHISVPDLLEWVADRFVHVYGESGNVDYVLTLRRKAAGLRKALAKALGEDA